jgi:hypothetical protein
MRGANGSVGIVVSDIGRGEKFIGVRIQCSHDFRVFPKGCDV